MLNTLEFDPTFKALTGHAPFPWQRRLFDRMFNGDLPSAVDIPTGLGKTAVMAVWLLARASGAPLPRRLVYVVDRRAVVDQATDFAEVIRRSLQKPSLDPVRSELGLADRALPISTLRGQHVDNREWLEDPAVPAIVVGTVDMIGSRLLFEGYGVSRRMRPYQAGLMGCDTLVLLDEAHLSRPFERLLRTIEAGRRPRAGVNAEAMPGEFAGSLATAQVPPDFRVLPLSATLGSSSMLTGAALTLDQEDQEHEIVRTRLDASKTLTVEALDANASIEAVLSERAWNLARREAEADGGKPVRMLVYCDRRKVAESVAADLRRRNKLAKGGAAVILFVGGRRVYERQEAADDLRRHGLLAGNGVPVNASVFVVATSAGEVGVDLDADHMVCDLVSWERMVQRLGRVNRRGSGAAHVLVIDQGPPEKKSEVDVARHQVVRALLQELPWAGDGYQAGPAALQSTARSSEARTAAASTPPPLHPALTRPLMDAWAMTSLAEHGGRPEVDPWLRGWVEQIPQTTVVWRRLLPVRVDSDGARPRTVALHKKAVEAFFEVAAPHAAERLDTETPRVVEWLRKRARKLTRTLEVEPRDARDLETEADVDGGESDDGASPAATPGAERVSALHREAPVAFVLNGSGKPADLDGETDSVLTLREAASGLTVKELERRLAGRLLVVDARMCGLGDGLLDAADGEPVRTVEDNWGEPHKWDDALRSGVDTAGLPGVRVLLLDDEERRRIAAEREAREKDGQVSDEWGESWATPYRISAAGLPRTWLVVEKRRATVSDEDSHAVAPLQRLEEHQELAAREAGRIAEDLGLDKEDRAMLVAAARRHDEGKRVPRWQRAFNAPRKYGPYAKTPGPLNRHVLDGYRHEFQSMLDAEANGLDGVERSDPRFDLALHMIAAHHGNSRPAIGIDGCDRLPPTAAARRAFAVGLRFARLQRQWGPWGLAWWEALLRAADQRASRALDEAARQSRKKETDAKRSPTTAPGGQLGLFPSSTGAGD